MKPAKFICGLAAMLAICCFACLPAMADTISFDGFGGSFSFANTSGSSLSVTNAGVNYIFDQVTGAVDSTVSGTLNLTSGSASSTCATSSCTVSFDAGGSLTIVGSDSALGISSGTTLLSATFADGSATFSSSGSGTFSGDLADIQLNSTIASYYGLTGLSGSDAETEFSVSFGSSGFSGAVGTSGITIADAPEPSSFSLLALVLLGGLLVVRKRVFA